MHQNYNILSQIVELIRDMEWHSGIKQTEEFYIQQMKKRGIYEWWLKEKLIEQRKKKLERICND